MYREQKLRINHNKKNNKMVCNTRSAILFEIRRGDDECIKVELNDEDDAPVDITDWQFKFTMKLNFQDDDSKAPIALDVSAFDATEAEAGLLFIPIDKTLTENLKPVPYFFDIQREYDGRVSTVLSGRIRVIPDVTRRRGIS